MSSSRNQTRRMVMLALLTAAGILMQLIESFFPVVMIVPGYKLGLANICGLYALYAFDIKSMVIVTYLRVILSCLAQGTIFSVPFWMSFAGCTVAMIFMIICYKAKIFSIYGVSVAGAAGHTFGQIAMITFLYQQYFMQLFAPVLLSLSIVSGLCIALLTSQLLTRLPAGARA